MAPAAVSGTGPPSPFAARADYVASDLAAVPDARPATGSMQLVVTFEPRGATLFDVPAPGSAPLTMAEIADRFGLTPANYSAAIRFFEARGLSILHTWPDRLSLTVGGPAAAVGAAFGTTIDAGSFEGRAVTFPAEPPSLPAPWEAEVGSVVGLSSGFDTFDLASLAEETPAAGDSSPAQGSGNVVSPAIARSIYDLSALYNLTSSPTYASSRSIALLLWGPGYAPNDISTFYQQDYPSGFPAPAIVPEPVDGAPSPSAAALTDPCSAEATELTLDLEWSGSMAPGATLYPVYAPEQGSGSCEPATAAMADAMHTAIGLPVSAVSMSFGVAESGDQALEQAWNTYLAEGVNEGITFLAATGDTGGYGTPPPGCTGGPTPEYPASSPDVLAVGGTDVSLSRSVLGQVTGFAESAWNDSGGGFSTQFSAPAWQTTTGSTARGMPDVSATASENFVYYNGQSQTAGGTSFATPLWAGLVVEMDAMHGSSLGLIAPRLYSIGAAEPSGKDGIGLADVTTGTTCIGTAGPGWDPETGWGSPRALLLYEDLTATFVSLSLAVSPSSVGPGGSVTIAAHLTNQTTGAAIVGVPVIVSLSSSTNLGPCTGTFGSSTPSTDAGGNISVSIGVPACYLGSHANAEVEVVTNGYYGTNSSTIAVNLLAFLPFLGGITEYPYNIVGFSAIVALAVAVGYALGRPRSRGPTTAASTGMAPPPSPPPSGPATAPAAGSSVGPGPPPVAPAATAQPAAESAPTPQKP
jgi:kumamolisin